MFKKILLGVDGSRYSLQAAEAAASLARNLGADLHLVVVHGTVPAYLTESNFQEAVTARLQESRGVMQKALDAVGEISGNLRTEILEGSAAEVILRVAESDGSDLIVMGSRGRGTLQGLLLGSQSQKVLQHAPCPVMIVR